MKDIRRGRRGSVNQGFFSFTDAGGTLFFRANDGHLGIELWTSDGTAAGTTLVRDIMPGRAGSYPYLLTGVGETLFFVVGSDLWTSDGTAPGTTLLRDVRDPAWLTDVGGTLFFAARDGEHGRELWSSDGSDVGTLLVSDISVGLDGSRPQVFAQIGGGLYFSADDGFHGAELWSLEAA